MAVTRVYLIRHAEAEGNLYRRLHGWYDSLITENGYRQIKALEERFRDVKIDAVYSSDLFRTRTTAEAIYKNKGLLLNTRRALREISVGPWEDRPFADLGRTFPEQFALFNSNDPRFFLQGCETFAAVRDRVSGAILDIAKNHPGKTVAVFSHGVAIRNALAFFMGVPLEQVSDKVSHGDNTAVAYLEVSDGKANVIYYNDNSHLSDDISTFASQRWWRSGRGAEDINLWFRPLNMKIEAGRSFFYNAREEAWLTIHGSMLHFDGDAFLRDAVDQANFDKRSVMLALSGEKPVGILQLNLRRDADKGVGNIPFFYLLPEYRCCGLGVQLLGEAVSVYRPLDRRYLRLRCAPDNYTAQRFYQRNGFVKIGEDPGSRVPLDIMEKYIGYEN